MRKVFKEVFINYQYLIIAALFGFVIFSFSVWLRNLPLLKTIAASSAFGLADKIAIFVKFLGGIETNVTLFSAFLIVTMSILFGVNAAMFAYYLIRQRQMPKKEGMGAIGAFVSGMFGVGCASCDSFLLGSLLASFGASGIITLFPLRGEEFSILSIAFLLLSIYWISKSIRSNKVCVIM